MSPSRIERDSLGEIEVPAAAYIVKAGASAPTEDELRTFLREHLMPYQIPVLLLAVDELPRTPSMKISQPALKALLEQELARREFSRTEPP